LDKLPKLKQLAITPDANGGYEEMFSKAVALITQLKILNKVEIKENHRRGAEYDIWKLLGKQWTQTTNNPDARLKFLRQYRCYDTFIQSECEFV
jgi:hypothetical protein